MNGTNVQRKIRKVKYVYDYPENRRVSEHLTSEDKRFVAVKTGYSIRYVCAWCQGTRRSLTIAELAKQISRINIAKQRKLNNKPNQSN